MIINNDNVTNYPFLNKKGGLLNCSLPYLKTNTSSIAAQLLLVKGKGHFDVSIEWDNCREMEEIKKNWAGGWLFLPFRNNSSIRTRKLSERLKNQLCIFSYTFQHRLDISAFGMRSASLAAAMYHLPGI